MTGITRVGNQGKNSREQAVYLVAGEAPPARHNCACVVEVRHRDGFQGSQSIG